MAPPTVTPRLSNFQLLQHCGNVTALGGKLISVLDFASDLLRRVPLFFLVTMLKVFLPAKVDSKKTLMVLDRGMGSSQLLGSVCQGRRALSRTRFLTRAAGELSAGSGQRRFAATGEE
ncbi:hypothetical protein C3B54_111734 [Pontimonas salivibrio]|uniref:Uncharacterized protein n=1 Tax=Pontimonas salivibrio TaxID=1159327 RepID=A0A2L2BSR9_9MICO|nr:hypothetical protein C3B54_111734 [Pontimonas salivibrio]